MDLDQKFAARVVKTDGGCWGWTGAHTTAGYATMVTDRQPGLKPQLVYVHRFIYERDKQSIPPGYCIDHLCRNRGCVNPEHLEAVTNKTNSLRGAHKNIARHLAPFCSHGHLKTPENFVWYKLPHRQGGRWICRHCERDKQREMRRNGRIGSRKEQPAGAAYVVGATAARRKGA